MRNGHLAIFFSTLLVLQVKIPEAHAFSLHLLSTIGIAISSVCLLMTLVFYGYLRYGYIMQVYANLKAQNDIVNSGWYMDNVFLGGIKLIFLKYVEPFVI